MGAWWPPRSSKPLRVVLLPWLVRFLPSPLSYLEMRSIVFALVVLTLNVAAVGAGKYGFGKLLTLGPHDELVHHKSLRVITADTVGFVYYQDGRKLTGRLDDPAAFTILEDGRRLTGHKVLGRFVKLHQMGHVPKPYLPATLVGVIYVRLARPMMEGKTYTFVSRGIAGSEINVNLTWSSAKVLSDAIKVNQVGYLPDAGIRLAYVGKWLGTGGALEPAVKDFSVIDLESGRTAFTGRARLRHRAGEKNEDAYKQDFSGENVYGLDFSGLKKPGAYCISIPGVGRSYSFRIGRDVMAEPLFSSIRVLYHARCGIALDKKYTPWTRNACRQHVRIGEYPEYGKPLDFKGISEFIKKGKAEGNLKYREVCGGYHDAADYDRRAIHIPIARQLCRVYEMNPEAFIDRQFIIPESGNGLPDILDEAAFVLRYYLETQWPDGGISGGSEGNGHPFTNEHPENAWRSNTDNESVEYIMRPVSAFSCFSFAASAAQLGRILSKFPEGKKQGVRLIKAAARAFSCGTRKFPPSNLSDEIVIAEAAAELLHATGEPGYSATIDRLPTLKNAKLDYLNNISLAYTLNTIAPDLPGLDQVFRDKLKKGCMDAVGWAVNAFTLKKGYIHFKHPWAPVGHGTASTAQAWWMALMWKMTGEQKYYDLLSASADVALGANPMGQVQCSGLGQRHLLHPEYLESMNDELEEYLPGIWVYGPSSGKSWITGIYPPTPAVDAIPLLYSYYDIDQWPGQTEFTVSETITPAVVMFGALAPKNPRPYTGPLPSPR